MKKILGGLGILGLALTILPPFGLFMGALGHEAVTSLMVGGMVLWFASSLPRIWKR